MRGSDKVSKRVECVRTRGGRERDRKIEGDRKRERKREKGGDVKNTWLSLGIISSLVGRCIRPIRCPSGSDWGSSKIGQWGEGPHVIALSFLPSSFGEHKGIDTHHRQHSWDTNTSECSLPVARVRACVCGVSVLPLHDQYFSLSLVPAIGPATGPAIGPAVFKTFIF